MGLAESLSLGLSLPGKAAGSLRWDTNGISVASSSRSNNT